MSSIHGNLNMDANFPGTRALWSLDATVVGSEQGGDIRKLYRSGGGLTIERRMGHRKGMGKTGGTGVCVCVCVQAQGGQGRGSHPTFLEKNFNIYFT